MQSKKELRSLYLHYRRSLAKNLVEELSSKIIQRFLTLKSLNSCQDILLYYSINNEIHTHWLIKAFLEGGKKVYLPYVQKGRQELGISRIQNLEADLEPGVFGIMEPREKQDCPPDRLDLVLVPGLAFTREGFRLGYGGGYYDRLLAKLSPQTLTVGLVYDALLLDYLPLEKHDQAVDILITEKEILFPGGDGIESF